MNNSHRITPGTMGRISQSAELEDEGAHETNSKFEKGNEHAGFQTGEMENFQESAQPPPGEYAHGSDSYDVFFQDAFNAFNAEMEKYYTSLGKMEQKEASVQSEIAMKIEEMKNLSHLLRSKRDHALQAIGQLTTFDYKGCNIAQE